MALKFTWICKGPRIAKTIKTKKHPYSHPTEGLTLPDVKITIKLLKSRKRWCGKGQNTHLGDAPEPRCRLLLHRVIWCLTHTTLHREGVFSAKGAGATG